MTQKPSELLDEMERDRRDASRWRKVMDLAVVGETWQSKAGAPIQHVWRFKPIMGPHRNLLDAVDAMGE